MDNCYKEGLYMPVTFEIQHAENVAVKLFIFILVTLSLLYITLTAQYPPCTLNQVCTL